MIFRENRFVTTALIMLGSCLLFACGGGSADNKKESSDTITFIHDGLQGLTINQLYQHHDQLFAATNDGLYVKATPVALWQLRGLKNRNVTDIVFFDPMHFMATVETPYATTDERRLMESTSAGHSWSPVESAISHNDELHTRWSALIYDEALNTLYGIRDNTLVTSHDSGRDWQPLTRPEGEDHITSLFITRHPVTHDIWSGGFNGDELPVLHAWSTDLQEEILTRTLSSVPGSIHSMTIDPEQTESLLTSGDQGIRRSTDNGKSWKIILAPPENRLYQAVVHDPQNPEWLYTSSWNAGSQDAQRLIFELSQDRGEQWTRYYYPASNFQGGTKSLLAVMENDRTVIYLGLAGGGIMKINMPRKR